MDYEQHSESDGNLELAQNQVLALTGGFVTAYLYPSSR